MPTKAIENAPDLTALTQIMSDQIADIGFGAFDAYSLRADNLEAFDHPSNWLLCDYGLERVTPYLMEGWIRSDPCLREVGRRAAPFEYLEFLRTHQDNAAARWQSRMLRLMGVGRAWCIPLNRADRIQGTTIYMRRRGKGQNFHEALPRLQFLSGAFIQRASDLHEANADRSKDPGGDLTTRERECLQWVAEGKTNWEIAQILSISENTVRYHMKNVLRKMQTSSRNLAAKRAQQSGALD